MGIGWSMHRNNGWRGQFERMLRWHERLRLAAANGGSEFEDFVYAFFQNCYCLRDFLQQTGGASQQELEALFSRSHELRLCRDICNGTKHLNISHASVDANFSIGREYAPSEKSGTRLFVIADSKHDVLSLASGCVEAWRTFVEGVHA